MLKLELIILPLLAFLGPSNITNASTKTPIPSSQLSDAKTGVNYEFITIAANYVNGMWLVDGRQRPVIKTSMTKEVAIKWSAAPDMTPQTVLYRRPVAQFSNFQPKIVSSWLILALFQANFLISGRSRLCPYQLVNSNQVRQGE